MTASFQILAYLPFIQPCTRATYEVETEYKNQSRYNLFQWSWWFFNLWRT